MSDNDLVKSESKPNLKRIITLDFIRGCAMIGVLGFHMLAVTYDVEARFDLGVENLPIAYIILVAILGFMGSLFPAFVLISAIGNTISMDKRWKKYVVKAETPEKGKIAGSKILKTQIFRGLFLIIADMIIEVFLNGVLTYAIATETGDRIVEKMLSELYHGQILSLIGWGVLFTSIVYFLCKRRNKSKKFTMITLGIICIAFIVLTPIVLIIFENIPGLKGYPNRTLEERSFILNVLYFFLSPIANGWYPIFPGVSIFFLGMIIGMEFSEGNFSKKFLNKIILTSIIYFVVGLLWYFLIENDKYNNDMLIPTAGSLLGLVILIYFIEIRGKGTAFAKKTIFFRRFGNLSLTIWALQWTMMIYLRIVHLIFYGLSIPFIDGPIFNAELSGNATWGLFFGMIPIWFLFLWGWERANYKGSLEWLFAKGVSKDSSKVDLKFALRNVESVIPAEKAQKFYHPWEIVGIFFLLLIFMIGSLAVLLELI
ncbi:MAG: hypothetical protein ACTSX0_03905 [Promethearchaeota archaeon]